MNNRIILAIGGLIVLLIGIFVFVNVYGAKIPSIFPFFQPKSQITIDHHTFSVTVAKSETEKTRGLSGKQSLLQNQGMLFVFSTPGYYSFWMKEMKFPLDIIYIRKDTIVTILQHVPAPAPQTEISNLPIYKPTLPADTVLEINAGLSNSYHFHTGDTVIIKL